MPLGRISRSRPATIAAVNPWLVDLVVVRGSFSGGERRSITRDVERGRLVRVRPGVYVLTATWLLLDARSRHVVRLRALVATSDAPPVFSHWSAAVVHRLPFLCQHRMEQVHVTVDEQERRGTRAGVRAHVLPVTAREVVRYDELVVTSAARTVVDIAGAVPFDEGVVVADGALRAHLPRELLDAAVDLAGARRASTRIATVAAFAHPGGESPAESESRVLMFRHGIEPPELQHAFTDHLGFAGRTDTWWWSRQVIGEVGMGTSTVSSHAMTLEKTVWALVDARRDQSARPGA